MPSQVATPTEAERHQGGGALDETAGIARARRDEAELVATESGDEVTATDDGLPGTGEFSEEPVADLVAGGDVDGLEAVEGCEEGNERADRLHPPSPPCRRRGVADGGRLRSSVTVVKFVLGALVGLFLTQLAFFSTSIYLHRTLAHRALRLSPTASIAFRCLLWLTTGMCPREWVAVHRKHHAFSDREGDPHSPVLLGVWTVQWENPVLYRRVARNPAMVARYARDLPPDRLDRLLLDRGWLGLAITAGVIAAAGGWEVMGVALAVHAVLFLGGSGAVNAIGHHWGRRPYDNLATNNLWLALLVAGEGLHNNHHAAPTSSRFSFSPTEIDPGWLVIRLLVRLRMADVRHTQIRPREPRHSRVGAGASS